MTSLEIRVMRASDFDAVDRVLQDEARFHVQLEPDWMTETRGISREEFETYLDAPGRFALVGVRDGELVAVALISEGSGIDPGQRYRPIFWVDEVSVAEGHRDQGIGRSLMRAAENAVRERGAKALCLDVWSSNARALYLYRELGFEPFRYRMFKPLDAEQ